jgi:hypothetical protein
MHALHQGKSTVRRILTVWEGVMAAVLARAMLLRRSFTASP